MKNTPKMRKLIQNMRTLQNTLNTQMNTLLNSLESVSPDSSNFGNVMTKLYFVKKEMVQLQNTIEETELSVVEDKTIIPDELKVKIREEKEYQEMISHFLPAMMFYSLCKNC